MLPRSIPHIVDIHEFRGVDCGAEPAFDLLIEVPHGATTTADFNELAALIESELPDGLVDFFYVNTDVGAFELAMATAAELVACAPERSVVIVRSRIPRTFIDCNRRIDASPEAFRAGGVTPGIAPYIVAESDLALLKSRYARYIDTVRAVSDALKADGAVLLLHTYGPRTVDVQVDADIVRNLRRAYEPDVEPTWPLRPEFDVIARDAEGRFHAPIEVVEALREALLPLGWPVADSATYPMHPSTMAWDHVMLRPGRALCLEVRRDLLVETFDPFVEMLVSAPKVNSITPPLTSAILRWWPATPQEVP
jgi:hypothetical protein